MQTITKKQKKKTANVGGKYSKMKKIRDVKELIRTNVSKYFTKFVQLGPHFTQTMECKKHLKNAISSFCIFFSKGFNVKKNALKIVGSLIWVRYLKLLF